VRTFQQLVLLAAALAIAACSTATAPRAGPTPGQATARTSLTLPFSGLGVAGIVGYAAADDYYQKYGLDVTSPNISAAPNLVASLLSGDVPIGLTSIEAVVGAYGNGADLVIIGGQYRGFAVSIISNRAITTANQLKGKRIGVTSYASPPHTAARAFLRANGVDPTRDVTFVVGGGMSDLKAGLESGAFEAAAITPPLSFDLIGAGYTELADLSNSRADYYQGVIVTTRKYILEKPDVVQNVLSAYTEAQRDILNNPTMAKAVLEKWVGVKNAAALDKTYEVALRGFKEGPSVDPQVVQVVINTMAEETPSLGPLKAAAMIDNTFANAASTQFGFAPGK
jgi:NitT/TauT family transport system substrate-binding protein